MYGRTRDAPIAKTVSPQVESRETRARERAKPRREARSANTDKARQATPVRRPTAGPAVLALLDKAKSEANAGEGEQAAATLERAIGIEPKNPWLWHRLAVLRLQQGHWQQALDLATKSNTLAGENARLLGGNWEVIASARQSLGDADGSRQAKTKSQAYFSKARTSD
jgi:Tfp pilus assembly protein PilF